MAFIKATKKQAKLRLALIGPSGSGKTYTALRIATALSDKVAFIDTERGSASKYADLFSFDVMELDSFHPQRYVEAIRDAEKSGYEVLVIDSLSHAWSGRDGALELVDRAAKRSQGSNTFAAWRDVTPLHNQLVDAMLGSRLHLLVTMRAKTEYVQERGSDGKTVIRKVGLAPVQRDGVEYEFDVVADLDADNTLIVSKSRCPALTGAVIAKAGPEIAATLSAWLSDGAPAPEPAAATVRVIDTTTGEIIEGKAPSPPPVVYYLDHLAQAARDKSARQQARANGQQPTVEIVPEALVPDPELPKPPAKPAANGALPNREKCIAYWRQLYDKALALGIEWDPPGDDSTETIIEDGKRLREAIRQAEAQIPIGEQR